MGAKEFDITDSVKVICENANDADFITRIVHDIYKLGYGNGYTDAEKHFSDIFNTLTTSDK